jgi:acetyltransferase-like isoleucine patch superfamily enzyme
MAQRMMQVLIVAFSLLIYSVPAALALAPVFWADSLGWQLLGLGLAPSIFAVSLLLTAGLLSLPFQWAIQRGRVKRSLSHRVYGPRRLYGLCWTTVYYFTPLYSFYLSIPPLKRLMLRLFGYRGSTDFTVYPDTWIRDLPLLDIGEGAYLSNKATIGSNICFNNGTILVDSITIGKHAMIGHMAMLAPGNRLGERSEIGVGAALGIRVTVGARSRVGGCSGIDSGARIGDDVEIGALAYVGIKAVIADGVKVPAMAVIPDRAVVRTSEEARAFVGRGGPPRGARAVGRWAMGDADGDAAPAAAGAWSDDEAPAASAERKFGGAESDSAGSDLRFSEAPAAEPATTPEAQR